MLSPTQFRSEYCELLWKRRTSTVADSSVWQRTRLLQKEECAIPTQNHGSVSGFFPQKSSYKLLNIQDISGILVWTRRIRHVVNRRKRLMSYQVCLFHKNNFRPAVLGLAGAIVFSSLVGAAQVTIQIHRSSRPTAVYKHVWRCGGNYGAATRATWEIRAAAMTMVIGGRSTWASR